MDADTRQTTFRLPNHLYRRLRKTAFELGRSQNDVMVAALGMYLDWLDTGGEERSEEKADA